MGKKVTVSLEVTYDFRGKLLAEYLEQLGDDKDTKEQRKWFVIDRFIGHDNYAYFMETNIIDRKSKLKTKEMN